MPDHILAPETVKGPAFPLEGLYNVHGRDSLPFGVFGVGDGVADDVLKKDLEQTPSLLVDEVRNPLDPSSPLLAKRRMAGFVMP